MVIRYLHLEFFLLNLCSSCSFLKNSQRSIDSYVETVFNVDRAFV
ncbi:hypothetical protein CKA32_003478 [Geitlerinema sp. FC II]|nr:hypothetical protein CKA32_003478 [Geitlerinema sp. FC II]